MPKDFPLPGILLYAGYLTLALAGLWGLLDEPSSALTRIAGYSAVSLLWNLAFVIAGIVGVVARLKNAPRVEIVAIDVVAGVMLLWAWIITVAGNPGSTQAAITFVALSALLFGWANGTRRRLDKLAGALEHRED